MYSNPLQPPHSTRACSLHHIGCKKSSQSSQGYRVQEEGKVQNCLPSSSTVLLQGSNKIAKLFRNILAGGCGTTIMISFLFLKANKRKMDADGWMKGLQSPQ